MYTLHIFAILYVFAYLALIDMLINKISALKLSQKFIKSALLVGKSVFPVLPKGGSRM